MSIHSSYSFFHIAVELEKNNGEWKVAGVDWSPESYWDRIKKYVTSFLP